MNPSRSHPPFPNTKSGIALVIVLAFVVLLTAAVVAFFSRTMAERQISDAGASQVKVELLAQGALEQLIGDLGQEIIASSNTTTITTGTVTTTLYTPTSSANILPAKAGFSANIPANAFKRSAGNTPFYPAGVSRAAQLPTTGTSQNGRFVSLSRWNAPLLLPKANGASDTDLTPITPITPTTSGSSVFTAPDWILIARNGSNPTGWNTNLRASGTNSTMVIGRYAYVIYDEGGLLDMNVAGYPTATSGSMAAYKTALSYADLTQIPGIGTTDPVTSVAALNSSQQTNLINNLVGWRNYASTGAGGALGSLSSAGYSFTSGSAYNGFVLSNTTGFLTVSSPLSNGQSDRRFTSRQQLIKFLTQGLGANAADRAKLQNALQYMGTFSRGLEQPSYTPDPSRPRIVHPVNDDDNVGVSGYNTSMNGIVPASYLSPDISKLLNNYRGGNDAYSKATDPIPNEDRINPAFLSIRVTGTFTRMDGSTAQIGEPLVKKRFPLSRLAWITHTGPGTDTQKINQIKAAFGLTWDATNNRWTYDHGFADATGSVYIGKLDEVRDQKREPDFFELLKATLNAGSLGKAAAMGNPNWQYDTLGAGTYYQMRDKSLECQIYQIGVNLIDQADSDSYPTSLWVKNPNRGGTCDGTKFFGVEDLPYFHRMFFKAVADKDDPPITSSSIALTNGTSVVISNANSNLNLLPFISGAQFYPGTTLMLGQPELWNPHDASTWSSSPVYLRPVGFRITAVSEDPDRIITTLLAGIASGDQWKYFERVPPRGISYYFTYSAPGSNYALSGSLSSITTTTIYHLPSPPNPPSQPYWSNLSPLSLFALPANASGTSIGGGFGWGADLWGNYWTGTWPDNVSNAMTGTATALQLGSCSNSSLFREPTLLGINSQPAGSGLQVGTGSRLTQAKKGVYASNINGTYGGFVSDAGSTPNVGFVMGRSPTRWIVATPSVTGTTIDAVTSSTTYTMNYTYQVITGNYLHPGPEPVFTIRLEYQDSTNGPWLPYDERFMDPGRDGYNNNGDIRDAAITGGSPSCNNGAFFNYGTAGAASNGVLPAAGSYSSAASYNSYDPRSPRFGHPMAPCYNSRYNKFVTISSTSCLPVPVTTTGTDPDPTNRPDYATLYNAMSGIPASSSSNGTITTGQSIGWFNIVTASGSNAFTQRGVRMGWLVENNSTAPAINSESPQYYADADDIVRRASGAFAADSGYSLPNLEGIGTAGAATSKSRPVVLNRPFRSVAEMSYAFRGSPWKNIDFSAPETGDAALLDVFCINEPPPSGLVAGKFNLNTRQQPVLKAILAGAIKSELNGLIPNAIITLSGTEAAAMATAVVTRTSGTNAWEGPLMNISELAGKLVGKVAISATDSSIYSYTVPSGRTSAGTWSYTSLGAVMANAIADTPSRKIQPFREASLRALADTGQCRVWNLMIDVIAQTGRYPQSATSLSQFNVEGEKRYWLHVAIDRLTGQVLDAQLEAVTE